MRTSGGQRANLSRGSISMRLLPPLARIRLAAKAAVGALRDPYLRGDLVAVLGETTGTEALTSMRTKMRQDPTGRRILAGWERNVIGVNAIF